MQNERITEILISILTLAFAFTLSIAAEESNDINHDSAESVIEAAKSNANLEPLKEAELRYQHKFTATGRVSDGSDRARGGQARFSGPMEARGLTYNNYQYAAYYEENGDIVVERRDLNNPDEWEKSILQEYQITSQNRHNRLSMGISGDGVIHLAFDHHNAPTLNYARSEKGVANNPEEVIWNNNVFSLEPNLGLDNVDTGLVTYPNFIPIGEGDMLLYWRSGGSHSGEMNLANYDSNAQVWSFIGRISSKYGVYDGVHKARGPYHGGFDFDSKGNIHIFLLWREYTQSQRNRRSLIYGNHGIHYTYSTDGGFTWFNNDNEKVADTETGDRMSIDDLNRVVDIPMELEPSNPSQTSAVDRETDDFHVILRHYRRGTKNMALHHYLRSPDGEWKLHQIIDDFVDNRPTIYFAEDLLYALLFDGRIYVSSRDDSFKDWERVNMPVSLSNSLNYYDMTRIEKGIVSIFGHEEPDVLGESTPIKLYEITIAR